MKFSFILFSFHFLQRGDSQDTVFFFASSPQSEEELSDRINRRGAKKSFSLRQESSRSWDESDPDSFNSLQRDALSLSPQNNNNIVISNLTGNLLSDSVVVNIEDNSSTDSNESNSVTEDDDDDEEMDEAIAGDVVLHHNDWEVKMLAAELKKRESVSDPQTITQSSENDGLLRRRKRRSDTDTDASENEASHSRPRAGSLDQQNLRKQPLKSRSVLKAMSFDRDNDQL